MKPLAALAAAPLLLSPLAAMAQGSARALASACPANGAYIAASRTAPLGAAADSTVARLTTPVDTTVTFAFAERRWTWPALWAVVAVGVQGATDRPAADTSGTNAAPWRACAGAAVTMEQATLLMRGASGRVRLRVDLSALRAQHDGEDSPRPR